MILVAEFPAIPSSAVESLANGDARFWCTQIEFLGTLNTQTPEQASKNPVRADFREGDEDSNFSENFRVLRFTESPGPLHWIAFPVEILTKPLIRCFASPLFTEKTFFSLKRLRRNPFPKIGSYTQRRRNDDKNNFWEVESKGGVGRGFEKRVDRGPILKFFIVGLKHRKNSILENRILLSSLFPRKYSDNNFGQLPPLHPQGVRLVRNEKSAQRPKFSAGRPCGHPAKNFGQALQIVEKQAFRHGHAARTSTKNLRSEKLRADFSFPN